MSANKTDAREKIISTTTQLIKEYGEISKITVRDIATKSGVGVGLLNYHFQTKDNLINICIQRIINEFLKEIEGLYQNLELEPLDKLRYVFKEKCNFVAANPGISKISMMLDLNQYDKGDNTDQAANLHFSILRQAYRDKKSKSELFVILHTLMSSIQVAFLRSTVFKLDTGIDFFDKEQREQFIDLLFDNVIRNGNICRGK